MPAWVPLAIAGSSIAGGLIGVSEASKSRKQSMSIYNQMRNRLDDLDIPDIEKQKLALEEMRQMGALTPELEQSIITGDHFKDMETDPRLKMEQEASLAALSEIAEGGGLRAVDRAALEEIKSDITQQERGQREAILQQMQRRGISGSGLELQSQLQAQQEAINRASQEGFNVAGQAQQRALQAILQRGELAGGMRGQDFGEQADIARARQAIEQFNVQSRIGSQQRNIDRSNIAAQENLTERQRIADQNTGTRNQQQQYSKALEQQQFNNEMAKITGQQTVDTGIAKSFDADAERKAKMWAGVGSGIGKGVASYGQYTQDQPENTFKSAKNYTYNYQPNKNKYA